MLFESTFRGRSVSIEGVLELFFFKKRGDDGNERGGVCARSRIIGTQKEGTGLSSKRFSYVLHVEVAVVRVD